MSTNEINPNQKVKSKRRSLRGWASVLNFLSMIFLIIVLLLVFASILWYFAFNLVFLGWLWMSGGDFTTGAIIIGIVITIMVLISITSSIFMAAYKKDNKKHLAIPIINMLTIVGIPSSIMYLVSNSKNYGPIV